MTQPRILRYCWNVAGVHTCQLSWSPD